MEKSSYQKMLAGEPYGPDEELTAMAIECSKSLAYINSLPPRTPERDAFLKTFFGSIGENVVIKANFNCDYGRHIHIGSGTFINYNVTILDTNEVRIGQNVLIAPGVVISPASHPLEIAARKTAPGQSRPVTIMDNAWIGANATVLGGVTIGKNAVVAAGAVVTKDVPDNCVVGGVPAKVIKKVNNEES